MWSGGNAEYERGLLVVTQLWRQWHIQWLLWHTGNSLSDGPGTWDVACKLSVLLSSPVLGSEWPPVPAAAEPESPEGLQLSLLFAAITARPARLPRGSTKHWDLPVLQMGKCTSRDDLNSRETRIFHWKCRDLCVLAWKELLQTDLQYLLTLVHFKAVQ